MSTPNAPHLYLSLSKCAAALGMTERTVKGWLESGKLPSIQPGGRSGRRHVLASDLLEFARQHGIECKLEYAL